MNQSIHPTLNINHNVNGNPRQCKQYKNNIKRRQTHRQRNRVKRILNLNFCFFSFFTMMIPSRNHLHPRSACFPQLSALLPTSNFANDMNITRMSVACHGITGETGCQLSHNTHRCRCCSYIRAQKQHIGSLMFAL